MCAGNVRLLHIETFVIARRYTYHLSREVPPTALSAPAGKVAQPDAHGVWADAITVRQFPDCLRVLHVHKRGLRICFEKPARHQQTGREEISLDLLDIDTEAGRLGSQIRSEILVVTDVLAMMQQRMRQFVRYRETLPRRRATKLLADGDPGRDTEFRLQLVRLSRHYEPKSL
jgi:hypothetical protein